MIEKLTKLNKREIITQNHHKNTIEYYQQPGATKEFIHVQAVLNDDNGYLTLVDLAENLHYVYANEKIHLYIDGADLKKNIGIPLDHYRVGYITKELKQKIIKEKAEGLAYRYIDYAPTGMFKLRNKGE